MRAAGWEGIQLSVHAISYLSIGMLCPEMVITLILLRGHESLSRFEVLKQDVKNVMIYLACGILLSLIKVYKKNTAKLTDAMIIL